MTLEEWARGAIARTLPLLRRPPPVRLMAHEDLGARRLLELLRHFGGALLFDGVGMGKSFTASAVAREWQDSGDVAVAAPAPLLPAWRGTLARFGVDAGLVSHDGIGSLPAPMPGSLLIVDEAHRFRNVSTRRYRRLAEASCGRALLLVTATPLCNALDDVRALARLAYADDAFKEYGMPSIDAIFEGSEAARVRSFLAVAAVRREPDGGIRFPSSVRRVVRFSLGDRGNEVAGRLERLAVPLAGEVGPALVRSHLRVRLESSPEALRDSLERQRRFYRRAREKLADGFVLRRSEFTALFEREERAMFQELLFPEAFLSKADPDATLVRAVERELKEIDAIAALLALPDAGASRGGKFERLVDLLGEEGILPAVVFTRAIATAYRVRDSSPRTLRVGLATSRGSFDPRGLPVALQDLVRSFRTRSVDLLVLTDLASEGLDLQAAATIIHFDLPWTAVKLAQRNGRAVRIGQVRSSVGAIYFVPEEMRRAAPLRFVSRKERLAKRYLETFPFEEITAERGGASTLAVAIPGGFAIVERGVVFILESGSSSADPREIRARALLECRGALDLDFWNRWKEAASLVPSRADRASPQGRLFRAIGAKGLGRSAKLLARRYRAGLERRLSALEGTPVDEDTVEEVLASDVNAARISVRSGIGSDPTRPGFVPMPQSVSHRADG